MTIYEPAHRTNLAAPWARPDRAGLRLAPAVIVIAAVLFNAALAVVNAHVRPLGPAAVIGAEVVLVAAAHGIAIVNYRREMAPWYVLIAIFVLIAIVRALVTGELEVKFLRDVVILPTFVVLGMAFDPRRLAPTVLILHSIVIAALVLEFADTSWYSALLKVQDYYIATRGYHISQFSNANSDLFVNAERPGPRLFSFIDLHRLSSVFLEPVSLGNYCIIVIAYACAIGRRIGRWRWWFLVLGAAAGIVAADGRLAAASSLAIACVSWLAPRLPPHSAIAYAPAVTIATIGAVHVLGLAPGTDDLPGRIANTAALLGGYDVVDYLGMSNTYPAMAVDSGLAYLIATQSLFGAALLYAFVVCFARTNTAEQIRFTHAACIYLAFTLMVSYAFLSIKTAAVIWFVYGALNTRSWALQEADHGPRRRR